MTTQKVTISLPEETFKKFKALSRQHGYSISGWITAQMNTELEKAFKLQKRYNDCTKLLYELTESKSLLKDIDKDSSLAEAKKIATNVYGEEIVSTICDVLESMANKE